MARCLSSSDAVGKLPRGGRETLAGPETPALSRHAGGQARTQTTALTGGNEKSNVFAGKSQPAQFLLEARSKVAPIERESKVGGEESEPGAAIVSSPVEAHPVKGLRAGKLDHAVGQLNLAPRALLDQFQDLEDLRLKDVAPRNDEVGRRRPRLRLLDHAGDFEGRAMIGADAGDPVLMRLGGRHFFDRNDIAAVPLVGRHALG